MANDTEVRLSVALQDLVGERPFTPDIDRIEARGRTLRHRRAAWRATAGTGLAVVAALVVAIGGPGARTPSHPVAGPSSPTASAAAPGTPLLRLVGHLTTAEQPAGDATLMLRHHRYADGHTVDAYDLYADDGTYYFSKTRAGLPGRVKGHHTEGGDLFRREVATAKYAATGDLTVARERMSAAANRSASVNDNLIWVNSLDALSAGAGNPTVRAGVLRLLSTMPEVTVRSSTAGGRPMFTLTAGEPALPRGFTESLTIDASTGIPVKFVGGDNDVTVSYTVTRVKLADVAKGAF